MNHPSCQETLKDRGQEDSIPFVPDGHKNHLLPLVVNGKVKKGSLLLVQDDVSVVAQKEGDGFGVAFPCSQVKCCILLEKIEHGNAVTMANLPFAISLSCFIVELLKRNY